MFVANLSSQEHDFVYRLPLNPSPIRQTIPPWSQVPLTGSGGSQGDFNTLEIESVIRHHSIYGMIEAREIGNQKKLAPLAYALDKPIPLALIQRAREGNLHILEARGAQIRQEAAVAANYQIEEQLARSDLPLGITGLEMTIQEEEPRRGSKPISDGHTLLNEGVRVSSDDIDPREPPRAVRARTARGAGRGRRAA